MFGASRSEASPQPSEGGDFCDMRIPLGDENLDLACTISSEYWTYESYKKVSGVIEIEVYRIHKKYQKVIYVVFSLFFTQLFRKMIFF